MKKFFTLMIILCSFLLLSACQLVIKDETKPTTNIDFKLIAYEIKDDNANAQYFRVYYLPQEDDQYSAYDSSPFFSNVHLYINSIDDKEEDKAELTYYTDLDQNSCFTFALIVRVDGEIQRLNEEHACDINDYTLSYQTNNGLNTYQLSAHLEDIDYLKSYELIQYDSNSEKLSAESVPLSIEPIKITLNKDTDDFIIIETYIDHDGKTYQKKSIHKAVDVAKTTGFKYQSIFSLDDQKARVHYAFEYALPDTGGNL